MCLELFCCKGHDKSLNKHLCLKLQCYDGIMSSLLHATAPGWKRAEQLRKDTESVLGDKILVNTARSLKMIKSHKRCST